MTTPRTTGNCGNQVLFWGGPGSGAACFVPRHIDTHGGVLLKSIGDVDRGNPRTLSISSGYGGQYRLFYRLPNQSAGYVSLAPGESLQIGELVSVPELLTETEDADELPDLAMRWGDGTPMLWGDETPMLWG